jgi:hypothetical protein
MTSPEWEAVQRWENEGGKHRQQHDYTFGAIGEGYQRYLDQAVTKGRLDTPNEITHATPILHPARRSRNAIWWNEV